MITFHFPAGSLRTRCGTTKFNQINNINRFSIFKANTASKEPLKTAIFNSLTFEIKSEKYPMHNTFDLTNPRVLFCHLKISHSSHNPFIKCAKFLMHNLIKLKTKRY